jgi:hypothetical protein
LGFWEGGVDAAFDGILDGLFDVTNTAFDGVIEGRSDGTDIMPEGRLDGRLDIAKVKISLVVVVGIAEGILEYDGKFDGLNEGTFASI